MPSLQEIWSYVVQVASQWWTLGPGGALAILGVVDWFREKPLLIPNRWKWYGALLFLVLAQFMAYNDLYRSSSAEATSQAKKVCDLGKEVKSLKSQNEALTNEKVELAAEKDETIEKFRGLLDQARVASTGQPPRRMGQLTYVPEAISTGRPDLPHGLVLTIQTSATIQPVSLKIRFNGEITEADVRFAGMISNMFGKMAQVSGSTFAFRFNGPAFTPASPLRVTVFSKTPVIVRDITED